jgi:hypothetical protein
VGLSDFGGNVGARVGVLVVLVGDVVGCTDSSGVIGCPVGADVTTVGVSVGARVVGEVDGE